MAGIARWPTCYPRGIAVRHAVENIVRKAVDWSSHLRLAEPLDRPRRLEPQRLLSRDRYGGWLRARFVYTDCSPLGVAGP
jgi:hypothetical protein